MSLLPRRPKLRLNGQPVRVVNGQMIDFLDFDFSLPPPLELKPRPVCTCGAKAIGCQPYMAGHANYCDVHEDKTPVSLDNPLYEKDNGSTETR